jgi:cyclomaltodextrinase / maltogenic alpha-amylase / neopullulanase
MRKQITFLIFSAILFLFLSCGKGEKQIFNSKGDPFYSLSSHITLREGENIIYLDDFVENYENIDSIFYSDGSFKLDRDKNLLTIDASRGVTPFLSSICIRKGEFDYHLVCKFSPKNKTAVIFSPENGIDYQTVSIAGDFNAWNATTHKLEKAENSWKINLELDPGLYQYQIVADGKWMNNTGTVDTVPNGLGGYNTSLNTFADCSTKPLSISTAYFDEEKITISVSQIPNQFYILWQNQLLPINLKNFDSNNYTFQIPSEADDLDRSYIRVFACTQECVSNDLYIPLKNGKVLIDTEDIDRADKFSNIMYFVLVDRFYNGNSENDFPLVDPRVEEKANYQGGDLEGVLKKLREGYFEKIGINCLWISPVFTNPDKAYQEFPAPHRYYSGYHGYWPVSSTEIDYRLGNDSIFMILSNEVHEGNMNIILDFVANHVHENHPLYQSHKDWATQLNLPDGRKNIRLWDEYRLTTWFDTFLPSWDFDNLAVTDTISEYALLWLRKFNLDGFRHDATKHIPEVFWRTLTKRIKTNFPDKSIYQIGETFGSRELIADYVGSGMMDGQFDFNLYFDARNCFAFSNSDMKKLAISLKSSLSYYGHHNLMGNITGNHDLIRFITYSDGSVKPGEDDKEAGWNRLIEVENLESYKKLQCLTAFVMTIPGIPCVYYGDEIGMPGAGDPDNRRMMKFDNISKEEQENLKIFSKLTELRRSNIELLLGELIIVDAGSGFLVYKRSYFGKETYIVFNQSDVTRDILIPKNEISDISLFNTNFGAEISVLKSNYNLRLKPFSFEVLTCKN